MLDGVANITVIKIDKSDAHFDLTNTVIPHGVLLNMGLIT